eukprot:TRINITY_DN105213_c0_g1_i1.p1 TRINITY_DN105213_c0_g1~~TRINITY_DN105213_c0_g1_i1.p1  ORF type:complete len:973 (-),score=152.43 TRINITY_DN105213_c0_g1_i1:193-3030(-)
MAAPTNDTTKWMEAEEKKINLERTDQEKLGLCYRVAGVRPVQVYITGIKAGGLIDAWNWDAHEDLTLCVGDQILEVNGISAPHGMIEQLVNMEISQFEIRFRRAGPRWHLQGTVAEAMDRVAESLDKGMSFQMQTNKVVEDQNQTEDIYPMTTTQRSAVIALVFLPTILNLVLFSAVGSGIEFYTTLFPETFNWLGNCMVAASAGGAMTAFVMDFHRHPSGKTKGVGFAAIVYFFVVGMILKCRVYATAPQAITLFHIPLVLGWMRRDAMKNVSRRSFFIFSGSTLLLSALFAGGVFCLYVFAEQGEDSTSRKWNKQTQAILAESCKPIYDQLMIKVGSTERPLDYDWDCVQKKTYDYTIRMGARVAAPDKTFSSQQLADQSVACVQVQSIWFLAWATPLGVAVANFFLSCLMFINGVGKGQHMDRHYLEKVLKRAFLFLLAIFAVLYVSSSIAGAAATAIYVLAPMMGASFLLIFAWAYTEIGHFNIADTLKGSKFFQTLLKFTTSDWVRACLLLGANVLTPAFLLLDYLRQKARVATKRTNAPTTFTIAIEELLVLARKWRWSSILMKVNWIVTVMVVLFLGSRWTYVGLSVLNDQFELVDFWVVCVLFFLVGFIMFMLPPIPGIPVYIFGGMIFALRGRTMPDLGFWGGIGVACIMSLVLKMVALCGQYYIGVCAGQSLRVQQFLGVDKEGMRAIEKLLKQPGLSLPKVAILVGGPDWPTSVICGILQNGVAQCLIGTLPIVFCLAPCVLSGAFLVSPITDKNSSEKTSWNTLATVTALVSGGVQLVAMMLAAYYIEETLVKHGDELRAYREEHRPIMELTAREAASVDAFHYATNFARLSCFMKWLLLSSVGLMLITAFMLFFLPGSCFRTFTISSRVADPWAQEGLNNDASSLLTTFGWAVLGAWGFAFILHLMFGYLAAGLGRKAYQDRIAAAKSAEVF